MHRMTLSRSSVVAMMRGVYWPPATWIATSSEPNVKTRNERFIVMKVSSSVRAPVTDNAVERGRVVGPAARDQPGARRMDQAMEQRVEASANSGTSHIEPLT